MVKHKIKLQHPSSCPNRTPDTLIENANECGATCDENARSQDAPLRRVHNTNLPHCYSSTRVLQFIMRTSHTEMDLQLQTCLSLMRVYFEKHAERTDIPIFRLDILLLRSNPDRCRVIKFITHSSLRRFLFVNRRLSNSSRGPR